MGRHRRYIARQLAGTGGFKAIPAGGTLFAHILATGGHHPISAPFDLTRFDTGATIDEGHAGVAH